MQRRAILQCLLVGAAASPWGAARADEALWRLLQSLVRRPEGGNLFMVTHGSTTYALTGESPGTGEMVVLTPQPGGGFRVAGRLPAG